VFAKLGLDVNAAERFTSELSGLALVRQWAGIATPTPIGGGLVELEHGCLLLFETLPERPLEARTRDDWRAIGHTLAALHQVHARCFGVDNLDGFFGLPAPGQPPVTSNRWADFYAERRLWPRLRSAADAGHLPLDLATDVERLLERPGCSARAWSCRVPDEATSARLLGQAGAEDLDRVGQTLPWVDGEVLPRVRGFRVPSPYVQDLVARMRAEVERDATPPLFEDPSDDEPPRQHARADEEAVVEHARTVADEAVTVDSSELADQATVAYQQAPSGGRGQSRVQCDQVNAGMADELIDGCRRWGTRRQPPTGCSSSTCARRSARTGSKIKEVVHASDS